MDFVLWLHIAAAIVTLGPVAVATMATPRAIRQGSGALPLLRWFHRTTRLYGTASLLVFLLGAAVVPLDNDVAYNQGWLSASMAIFLVGFVLVFVIAYDQRKAIRELTAGRGAAERTGRLAALAGISSLLWLVVLALMVFKPGGPSS